MRTAAVGLVVLTVLSAVAAQVPRTELEPSRIYTSVPTVSFSCNLEGGQPSYYSISADPTGTAAYRSNGTINPGVDGVPFIEKFVISPATAGRIFDLAKRLHWFK